MHVAGCIRDELRGVVVVCCGLGFRVLNIFLDSISKESEDAVSKGFVSETA